MKRNLDVVRVFGAILLPLIVACSGTEPTSDIQRANRGRPDAGTEPLDSSSDGSWSADSDEERNGAELDGHGEGGRYFFGDTGIECVYPAEYDHACSVDGDCALVQTCVGQDPYAWSKVPCTALDAISANGPKGLTQWQADIARNASRLVEAGVAGLLPPGCLPPMFARCVAGGCVAR